MVAGFGGISYSTRTGVGLRVFVRVQGGGRSGLVFFRRVRCQIWFDARGLWLIASFNFLEGPWFRIVGVALIGLLGLMGLWFEVWGRARATVSQ